jgi:hypothetical protein
MPSLSDKLKALGVKVGAQDIKPPAKQPITSSLETIIPGRVLHTSQGDTYRRGAFSVEQLAAHAACATAPLETLSLGRTLA